MSAHNSPFSSMASQSLPGYSRGDSGRTGDYHRTLHGDRGARFGTQPQLRRASRTDRPSKQFGRRSDAWRRRHQRGRCRWCYRIQYRRALYDRVVSPPGLINALALAEYLAFMLAVIKVIPVTLTASGIAGLIISVGMAVDANVLIFERTKEELRSGKTPREAVRIGFSRAWPAIRDGHLTMIISGVILFWLGMSIVQGFALVFVLGVLASFISAVSLSRVFLLAIVPEEGQGSWKFLLGSGFHKN